MMHPPDFSDGGGTVQRVTLAEALRSAPRSPAGWHDIWRPDEDAIIDRPEFKTANEAHAAYIRVYGKYARSVGAVRRRRSLLRKQREQGGA